MVVEHTNRLGVVLLLAVLTAAAALTFISPAAASTETPLTWATACTADPNVAACERLTFIANKLDDPAPEPPSSTTAVLTSDDQERLDLQWQGTWFLAGAVLVLMLAPMFVRAFKWWQD